MVDILMDNKTGRLLYKEEIEELYKSPEGRILLKQYMMSAKVAYAAQEAMNYMYEIDKKISEFTNEEITGICDVLYISILHSTWDKVEEYLRKAVKQANFDKEDYEKYMEC